MKKIVAIYADEGACSFGVRCLEKFFQSDSVLQCDSKMLIQSGIPEDTDIFVMPGGADLPYCRALNGTGNAAIRRFVENGGTYLGLCAGAYYACCAIEFHKGRDDEISGPRELAFADAVAVGSLRALAPYYDETLHSAATPTLITKEGERLCGLYHGGPAFHPASDNAFTPHARYDFEGEPAAVIETQVGRGRAILSGVHLEMSMEDLANWPFQHEGERQIMDHLIERLAQNRTSPQDFLRGILQAR